MRLAFIAPEFLPTWGGLGPYSVELIKNLCKHTIDIHLLTPRRGKNYDVQRVLDYFTHGITIHTVSTANDYFFYNIKFQLALAGRFFNLHRIHHFDIVHVSNLVNMPDFFLKILSAPIPTVTTVHSTLRSQSHIEGITKLRGDSRGVTEKLTARFYPLLQCLEQLYLRKSSHLIAVSEWVTQFLPDKLRNTTTIIHNGVDINRFSPEHRNAVGHFPLIEEIKKPIVLYTGRLLALKGLGVLVQSMKRVLKNRKAHFVIAGTGDISRWKRMLSDVPVDCYTFLGYVDYERINYLYAYADIFVLPSLTESFPLVLLEAMASGVPVIASRVGGVPEMIEHLSNGVLVEPRNPHALADSIELLLDKPALRKKLSKKARSRVEL
jgi:glycosyltransferase involved in cell wall biosynthesis